MWGQGVLSSCPVGCRRIIPTRVGTRANLYPLYSISRDHPHACGDKLTSARSSKIFSGSSPRVWGQAQEARRAMTKTRIIPTRVGTRIPSMVVDAVNADHPHACGDKDSECIMDGYKLGSSPRVWGQASFINRLIYVNRIIPTRVGTSLCLSRHTSYSEDHPHACGDKISTT